MTNDDYADLLALAGKATPGERLCLMGGEKGARVCFTHTKAPPGSAHEVWRNDEPLKPEDEGLMLACTPERIRALILERNDFESQAKAMDYFASTYRARAEAAEADADRLAEALRDASAYFGIEFAGPAAIHHHVEHRSGPAAVGVCEVVVEGELQDGEWGRQLD